MAQALAPAPTASSSRCPSRPSSPTPGSPPLVSILKHKHRESATSATGLPSIEKTAQLSPQPSSVAIERTSTQQSGSGNLHYTRGVAFDTFEAGDDLKTGGGTGVSPALLAVASHAQGCGTDRLLLHPAVQISRLPTYKSLENLLGRDGPQRVQCQCSQLGIGQPGGRWRRDCRAPRRRAGVEYE